MITVLFSVLYIILHLKTFKSFRVQKGLLINFLFIITITSFFWAPMLETRFSTQYQVYETGAMSTQESVASHALQIKQLFATKNDGSYVFELGPHVIIMLVFSIMTVKRLKEQIKKEYVYCLICAIICLWMSTKYFPWKIMPGIITIIQFPWRMLFIAGFFISVICSINMTAVINKFNIKDVIIISSICVIYILALNGFVPYSEDILPIENYSLGEMSGKNIEVVAGTGKAEYLPKKAFDNRFYIATRENAIYVLSGKAIIENEQKEGTNYKAKIQTIEQETIFELPYIFYPGYEVRTDGMILDTFETENGFLGFKLDNNEIIELEVSYVGTKVMKISLVISVISTIIYCAYVWKKR